MGNIRAAIALYDGVTSPLQSMHKAMGVVLNTFEAMQQASGKRELFIAQDGAKMNQWGVLQYFEEVQTKTGASAKADALLKLYDQKTRKLTIQNAFGDVRVRAGSAVVVALNLGDIVTNNYMVVNKVTHTFRGDEHMMELDLIGGEFIA